MDRGEIGKIYKKEKRREILIYRTKEGEKSENRKIKKRDEKQGREQNERIKEREEERRVGKEREGE